MEIANKINELLVADVKRRLITEGTSRILKCIDELSLEQIWHKQNSNTNSVGNLVLHLCGNVRQYLLSGVDGQKDVRERSNEFSEKGPLEKDFLKQKLSGLMDEVEIALDKLVAEDLIKDVKVQGFDENVTSILVHVAEHFSYHVGQITYYTKYIKDVDTGYYAGLDLDVVS